jgi:hypothetical protein
MNRLTRLLTGIALKQLGIKTLERRNSDSLDFHEVSVWAVDAALREAYWRGFQDADPNGYKPLFLQYQAIAEALARRGYCVINGYGKGGFWVRNPDMARPFFVDKNSFIGFAKAKRLVALNSADNRQPFGKEETW